MILALLRGLRSTIWPLPRDLPPEMAERLARLSEEQARADLDRALEVIPRLLRRRP